MIYPAPGDPGPKRSASFGVWRHVWAEWSRAADSLLLHGQTDPEPASPTRHAFGGERRIYFSSLTFSGASTVGEARYDSVTVVFRKGVLQLWFLCLIFRG